MNEKTVDTDALAAQNAALHDEVVRERVANARGEVVGEGEAGDDSLTGAALGATGGALVGAAAGALAGPVGAVLGAALGALAAGGASGLAVGAVEEAEKTGAAE